MAKTLYKKVMHDNIHGHIVLNRVESRILETPYFQRLRWIKQLGFTFYIYPGATHTRHAHVLGVLHMMDKTLKAIGKAVPEDKLFDPDARDEGTQFHRTMRLAAMLHDIGTMPFSHTIEIAYINFWRSQRKSRKTKYEANHENLGSHIIENTDFDGGITKILKEEGINPKELSETIAGHSSTLLANQLIHSDVDADRMDYLLRDARHTGVHLGSYDQNLLLKNLAIAKVENQEVLCVQEDAVNVVESFLTSRYFWYSQIINDGTGYKFDLIAAKIYQYFLENGLAYSFDSLMDQVSQNPNEYFTFNDSYFMAKLHEYLAGRITHPLIRELSEMLASRKAPAQIKIDPVTPTLVESEDHRKHLIDQVLDVSAWLENEIHEIDPNAWMIYDIPQKDVIFTKGHQSISGSNPVLSRDPVKVLTRHGDVKLLIDMSHSLLKIMSQYRNFIPRIYVSPATYEKLDKKGILEEMRNQFSKSNPPKKTKKVNSKTKKKSSN
tara:strand:+ start:150838 stop:152319 length:1482 start_codon:yes stop_codon:yes gene_type:complete